VRADNNPDVYMVAVGDGVLEPAFLLVEQLRDALPHLKVEMNCGGGSFKAQMKRADRSGARVALVLGETEISARQVGIKPLREDAEQVGVEWSGLSEALGQYFVS
jgi:histidyl-tRNA synthetase